MAARGTRRGVPCRNPGFADAISFESTDVSDFDMSAINRHHEQEHGHIDIRVNAAGRPQRDLPVHGGHFLSFPAGWPGPAASCNHASAGHAPPALTRVGSSRSFQ